MPPSTDDTSAQSVDQIAREHPSLVRLAKAGWLAKGVVYVLLGALALQVAMQGGGSSGGEQASQTGALQEVADSSFGGILLWVLAIGLALYSVWRVVSVTLPTDGSAKAKAQRIGWTASAILYAFLAWTAGTLAAGSGGSSQGGGQGGQGGGSSEGRIDEMTRTVMEWPAGRWIIGAVGVAIIVVAVVLAIEGWKAKFTDELEGGGVGPVSHDTIVQVGRAGWIGRAGVVALIGWFVLQAALDYQPDQAQGLDGALRETAGSTIGTIIVVLVAAGLALYGVFCLLAAPRVKLTSAD